MRGFKFLHKEKVYVNLMKCCEVVFLGLAILIDNNKKKVLD